MQSKTFEIILYPQLTGAGGGWEAVTAVTPIGNYEVELKSWKCILVQLRARQKHGGRDTYCV